MRYITSAFCLAVSSIFCQESNSSCQPPPNAPYDYDLFHKDVEVWFASGEFLYWTADEGALDYAQRMNQPVWGPSTSYASGKVQTATFDLDPGFRLGIGYFNAPKYWEVRAQYTHFITRGKNRVEPSGGSNEFLTGTWPQITSNALTHAHSKIFLNYNLFNLLIDRVFITNPHLRLRLMAGLVVPWIEQDWKVQYFDGAGNTTIRNQWHYTGAGLTAGFSGDWYWGNHIYITGKTSFAVYMGRYRNQAKQTTTFQPTGNDNPELPVRNSDLIDTRPAFQLQFIFGPSWQQNFGCNRVELFAGYEINTWSNLQEIRRSSGGSGSSAKETWMSTSMLALQGLTTRLTVDY